MEGRFLDLFPEASSRNPAQFSRARDLAWSFSDALTTPRDILRSA